MQMSDSEKMTLTKRQTHTNAQCSTHLVRTHGAEGFLSRVRGQGKRVDFGQT